MGKKDFGWRGLGIGLAIVVLADCPMTARAENDTSAFVDATTAYRKVLNGEIDATIAAAQRMEAAMAAADLAGSRKYWIESHASWERLEVITIDLFPDQQDRIDGWPKAKTGYHAIEDGLFGPVTRVPKAAVDDLLDRLDRFRRLFQQSELNGYFLLAGAATMTYAIGFDEADGRESAVSGTSVDNMRHNIEALQYLWKTVFADALAEQHKPLADDIFTRMAGLHALVDVPDMSFIDPAFLQQEAYALAGKLAEAAVAFGWNAPKYKEIE
jgi:iron uptake system component EfeO